MENLSAYTVQEINIIKNNVTAKNRFLLLTGGVGVGKTMYAKILAKGLVSSNSNSDDPILMISVGEQNTYENMIYGLSVGSDKGKLKLVLQKQRLLEFSERARTNYEQNGNAPDKYVAILDDINRADISRLLGDMLSAMESEDVGNDIHVGGQSYKLPPNLYIIATANPLVGKESLDYAWMRRFVHYNIPADERHFGFGKNGDNAFDTNKNEGKILWGEGDPSLDNADKKISNEGITVLRYYQWDIFMHVKEMYERYYYDSARTKDCYQYMPGHGMFLNLDTDKSFGWNIIAFRKILYHVVLPLLEKQLSNEILIKAATPCISSLKAIAGGDEFTIETTGKELVGKNVNIFYGEINSFFRESRLTDAEKFLFFLFGNLTKRRNSNRKRNIEWIFYLCERKEFRNAFPLALGHKDDSGNVKPNFPHARTAGWKVEGYYIHSPQEVTHTPFFREGVLGSDKETKSKDVLCKMKELFKLQTQLLAGINDAVDSELEDKMMNEIDVMDGLNVRQMILQGPPGTSKTYGAKYDIIGPALAKGEWNELPDKKTFLNCFQIKDYEFEGDKPKWDKLCGWDMVQFHPSYCYEDFVRGITVSTDLYGNVKYETVNKILGKICKLAEFYENDKDSRFFLIIDEINRADIATVFGELIYALENRGEEVSIPYEADGSYKLRIPENLYIIGTMNTADKSIGTIDYAIRRRFLFFDSLPDTEVLKKAIRDTVVQDEACNMLKNLKSFVDIMLTDNYRPKDLYIGHTYLIAENEETLKQKLQFQILPILREYAENGVLNKTKDDVKWNEWKGIISPINDSGVNAFKSYMNGDVSEAKGIESLFEVLSGKTESQDDNK